MSASYKHSRRDGLQNAITGWSLLAVRTDRKKQRQKSQALVKRWSDDKENDDANWNSQNLHPCLGNRLNSEHVKTASYCHASKSDTCNRDEQVYERESHGGVRCRQTL